MFLQSSQHVDSYYAHSCADLLRDRPMLQGDQDTDIVIVGAGFSGLHTALRLALAGKRVTLLEASRVAWAPRGVTADRRFLAGHATCRRWKPRWGVSGPDGCGTACAGRLGNYASCLGGMVSTAIIDPGICGRR